MNKNDIIKNLEETQASISEFINNSQLEKGSIQLNHEVIAQVIMEFSEALLYLLKEGKDEV